MNSNACDSKAWSDRTIHKDWLAIGSEVAVVPRTAPAFVIGRTADGVRLRYWQSIGGNEGQWCEDEFSIDRIVVPFSLLMGGDHV